MCLRDQEEGRAVTWIAMKILTGNRGKYYSIVFGISFACMLMAQQLSIFVGLMRNTTSQIRDIPGADIWVMDPSVQYIEDVNPLAEIDLYRVRGVPGVAWAVRLYKGMARGQFGEGNFKQFMLIGLDDETLTGAPAELVLGSLADLRRPDAVIIDLNGYRYLFPDEPVRAGRVFEMNDRRAEIVGVCRASPTFITYPIAYTRYSQAVRFAPQERRSLSFVLAQADPGVPVAEVCRRVHEQTGLTALSQQEFADRTVRYYMERTGIPVNFGITVVLGFIIGAAIAGQTFYLFTLDHLKQYGALKAMGATNGRLLGMVLLQGLVVGLLGYGIGVGLAAGAEAFLAWKLADSAVLPATYMAWQIPAASGVAAVLIVCGSAVFSLRRVLRLEPAAVFR
jgi:putative ABC transport system permease protein